MKEETDLNKMPFRIRYYLLDWKDRNQQEYYVKFGIKSISQLDSDSLHDLFSYATTKDGALLARTAANK